ncbi:hypothetical protein EHI8A_008000 [Entamoeba histolytica HM-1:IMSS-B]|uniref:TLDc domain-containing protein n=6 Tax=Entamoeba histolytica TaxID=5759 RepID=C4M0I6_ENTH1|nr:hypothetical protein EHI_024440 [Entamoeba histolytica HM-1:IMSS]EMD44995.1 Hypothetical protein EHI5A_023080 [Entamoeba histolytica KU27]EMH75777.1 hypothetical protein EHI8A_008000 [Entamoeba histolytica HM-1:IMSS-B]EMS11037.1 hypothetical protein KM1_025650 [Entamoeba histolytica HM-3:IMSS]ENY65002.1 hypothetical protein EHI7A_010990 [Entamoeba histolytica HM-1:IMSS-A]GAT94678.1 hypothetical protein CL6EHI_024440 [Entamoeba histolytica]|eukprot:XP_650974.1 hypothetical protein EHI_024440 [Entamoeba histolytica HM-1:IMSS]
MSEKNQIPSVDSFLHKISGLSILNYGTINICVPPLPNQISTEKQTVPLQNEIITEGGGGIKRKINPVSDKKKKKQKNIINIATLIELNKELFVNWTKLNEYELIYDSKVDGFSSVALNGCICGKENIMVIIITKHGYVFGSFNSLKLPIPKKTEEWVKNDPNFFVFTLSNPKKTSPIQFFLKDKTADGLNISPNTSKKWIIATNACFGIKQVDGCYISNSFVQYYNIPNGITEDIFVGSHYPQTYDVSKVIALQWKLKK